MDHGEKFVSSCVVNMEKITVDHIIMLVSSVLLSTTAFILRLVRLAVKYSQVRPSKVFGLIEIVIVLAFVLSGVLILIVLVTWLVM